MKCKATTHSNCMKCKICQPVMQERVHILENKLIEDSEKIREQKDMIDEQKETICHLRNGFQTEVQEVNRLKEELKELKEKYEIKD